MKITVSDQQPFLFTLDGKRISTSFCIVHNDTFFPDVEWTDLTDVIISSWLQELSYQYKPGSSFKLFFYDGPYRLDVQVLPENMLHVRCICFRHTDRCEMEFECSLLHFICELRSACSNIYLKLSENTSQYKHEWIEWTRTILLEINKKLQSIK